MKKYFNILFDWNFNKIQLKKLKDYYLANLRLFQCLNSECYVNSEVRQEIEETLLLPIAEIEKRKSKLSS